jgi:hypothetical protein
LLIITKSFLRGACMQKYIILFVLFSHNAYSSDVATAGNSSGISARSAFSSNPISGLSANPPHSCDETARGLEAQRIHEVNALPRFCLRGLEGRETPKVREVSVAQAKPRAFLGQADDHNCCASVCAYTCCLPCPNRYPTSFCPFKGERENICKPGACCEFSDDVKKSSSACFPLGMIASLFGLCYRGVSNCFHDCMTRSAEENRGDCCQGPACFKYGCCTSCGDDK